MTMTREEAKKMLPIIKAWAEGREVEYNDGNGCWVRIRGNSGNIQLDAPAEWYRVVPRYRPFRDNKEFMKALREHGPLADRMTGATCFVSVLLDNYFYVNGEEEKVTYDDGFDRFIFKDGEPFGVKE